MSGPGLKWSLNPESEFAPGTPPENSGNKYTDSSIASFRLKTVFNG
jgi:hypothetical protein